MRHRRSLTLVLTLMFLGVCGSITWLAVSPVMPAAQHVQMAIPDDRFAH